MKLSVEVHLSSAQTLFPFRRITDSSVKFCLIYVL